jgi:hypothetical protein
MYIVEYPAVNRNIGSVTVPRNADKLNIWSFVCDMLLIYLAFVTFKSLANDFGITLVAIYYGTGEIVRI